MEAFVVTALKLFEFVLRRQELFRALSRTSDDSSLNRLCSMDSWIVQNEANVLKLFSLVSYSFNSEVVCVCVCFFIHSFSIRLLL